MIKKCPGCGKKREMRGKRRYCNDACKKRYENSLRGTPKAKKPTQPKEKRAKESPSVTPSLSDVVRPEGLNEVAARYWDKVAPTVIARGHLNVLSEDAFAELCDLFSRLADINTMINMGIVHQCSGCGTVNQIPGNRSLLQVDDKWDNKAGTETQSFKESALSDLKRKYSKQFLDYCKEFYLTPRVNRGNFGLEENGKPEDKKDDIFD